MSSSAELKDWKRFKNAIRTHYLINGYKLEGPDGVIERMKREHGFVKTRAQCNKKLRDWGFLKSQTKENWKALNQKIEIRKRAGKDSNVYCGGELIPAKRLRKELSRQGYLTFSEQLNLAQRTPPQTPAGFEIRTPVTYSAVRLAFENLPILHFQATIQQHGELLKYFDSGSMELRRCFETISERNTSSTISVLSSLLPFSALQEESYGPAFQMQRAENLGPIELWSLICFLIANNFPGETNREYVAKWLKTNGSPSIIRALVATEGPTKEALLESLFRFAIEAEDLSTIKILLSAGVSPNGHCCRHKRIPDNLTPLQFACIRGNAEMAEILVRAGSTIDAPGAGWKCSALVLAIMGENLRGDVGFWTTKLFPLAEVREDGDETDEDEDEEYEGECYGHILDNDGRNIIDNVPSRQETANFLKFINFLIEAGAAINISDIEQRCQTPMNIQLERNLDKKNPDQRLSLVMQSGHSPLTAASKYRNLDLVNLLINKGAEINFITDKDTTALHECLYSWEGMMMDRDFDVVRLRPLSKRKKIFRGARDLSSLTAVAYRLLNAGANKHDEFLWKSVLHEADLDIDDYDQYDGSEYDIRYTILDLAVFTESIDFIYMLLQMGTYLKSYKSVAYILEFGNIGLIKTLLSAGTSVSADAIRTAVRKDTTEGGNVYLEALLSHQRSFELNKAAFIEALTIGSTFIVEYLLKDRTCNSRRLYTSSEFVKGIKECCSGGHYDTLRLVLDKSSFPLDQISEFISIAGSCGRDEIVDLLLSRCADAKTTDPAALLAVVRAQDAISTQNLLNAGISTCTKKERNTNCLGLHPNNILIAAIKWGNSTVINHFLNAGADIDALGFHTTGDPCISPLTAAIIQKNSRLVKYLIDSGSAVNIQSRYSCATQSPLSAATINMDFQLVSYLTLIGANPYDIAALQKAVKNFELLQILLRAMENVQAPVSWRESGCKVLSDAVQLGDKAIIEAIIFSPLIKYFSFDFALCEATKADRTPTLEIMRLIWRLWADPGQYESGSGLLWAINVNIERKVRLLLEMGVRTIGRSEYSPMQAAVWNGSQNIVQILLDYGFSPNDVSPERGGTPLQIAVRKGDLQKVKVLLQSDGDPNTIHGDMSHSALQMACRDGNKEMIEVLIEYGANVNSPPARQNGATALQFAALKGYFGIAYLLMQHDADVNAPPAEINGRTALEGAAENGRLDMVQYLLNSGADIYGEGPSQYEHAVERASANGHHAVRRLLEEYHATHN